MHRQTEISILKLTVAPASILKVNDIFKTYQSLIHEYFKYIIYYEMHELSPTSFQLNLAFLPSQYVDQRASLR
uniref:Uncharacterized protein n=1 Tax=Anguilla anguilla TaxID=7936 RepID=A0A0E9S3B3_ANGAN